MRLVGMAGWLYHGFVCLFLHMMGQHYSRCVQSHPTRRSCAAPRSSTLYSTTYPSGVPGSGGDLGWALRPSAANHASRG